MDLAFSCLKGSVQGGVPWRSSLHLVLFHVLNFILELICDIGDVCTSVSAYVAAFCDRRCGGVLQDLASNVAIVLCLAYIYYSIRFVGRVPQAVCISFLQMQHCACVGSNELTCVSGYLMTVGAVGALRSLQFIKGGIEIVRYIVACIALS